MGDLRPCPFCGGEVEIERGKIAGAIQCIGRSPCRGTGLLVGFSIVDEATAIAAWNRRAATPLDEPGPVDPGRRG